MTRAERAALLRRLRQAREVAASAHRLALVADELLADVQRAVEAIRPERPAPARP